MSRLLASAKVSDIPYAMQLEGAQHLAKLAAAADNGQPQAEALAGWKKWLNALKAPGPVPAVLANAVIIAGPVARVLGIPM